MLKKADVVSRIDARLQGEIDNEELVEWAHECFIGDNEGENPFEEEWVDIIDEVIYRLQASDEPEMELTEEVLKDLRQKLAD
jgi:hypothetical protein